MRVGFVGLGRMGQAMTRRLLDGGHEVGVYNRTADKLKPLIDLGAKPQASIKAAVNFGAAVFTMLSDDAALFDVVEQPGGLKETLPSGGFTSAAGRTASQQLPSSRRYTEMPGSFSSPCRFLDVPK